MNQLGDETITDERLFRIAAKDEATFARFQARHAVGTLAAYVVGFTIFRGRRIRVDETVYVTDPEVGHLADAVMAYGDRLSTTLTRPLRILDFGVGAGALLIDLLSRRPEWQGTGIDISPDAIRLAHENCQHHGVKAELYVSDLLDGIPRDHPPPDIVFGDPPWGTRMDLYDASRDAAHYDAMPAHSAYPEGGPTGVHDRLYSAMRARGWQSLLLLNYGVLSEPVVRESMAGMNDVALLRPHDRMTIGHCRAAPRA